MTTEEKTEELIFELPDEVKDAIKTTRERIRVFVEDTRAEFDEADGEARDDADDIIAWFDELSELADNLETVPERPDTED